MSDTMEYAESTESHNMTTEEIVDSSVMFMTSAARVIERGQIIDSLFRMQEITESEREELFRMIFLAGRNARVAYQYATRDYGGMYVALVGHTKRWSVPLATHFEAINQSTPRDWSLHS